MNYIVGVVLFFAATTGALKNEFFSKQVTSRNSAPLRKPLISTFTSQFTGKTYVLNGTLLIDDFADTFSSYKKKTNFKDNSGSGNQREVTNGLKMETMDSSKLIPGSKVQNRNPVSTFISPYTGISYPLNGTIVYDGFLRHQKHVGKLQLQGSSKNHKSSDPKRPSAFFDAQNLNLNRLNLSVDKQKSAINEVSDFYQIPITPPIIGSALNQQIVNLTNNVVPESSSKAPANSTLVSLVLPELQNSASTTPISVDKTTPQTTPSSSISSTPSSLEILSTSNNINGLSATTENPTCGSESTCIPWTICSEFEGLYSGPCGKGGFRICCKLPPNTILSSSNTELSSGENLPTQATTPVTTLQPPLILDHTNPTETNSDDSETTTSYETTETEYSTIPESGNEMTETSTLENPSNIIVSGQSTLTPTTQGPSRGYKYSAPNLDQQFVYPQ